MQRDHTAIQNSANIILGLLALIASMLLSMQLNALPTYDALEEAVYDINLLKSEEATAEIERLESLLMVRIREKRDVSLNTYLLAELYLHRFKAYPLNLTWLQKAMDIASSNLQENTEFGTETAASIMIEAMYLMNDREHLQKVLADQSLIASSWRLRRKIFHLFSDGLTDTQKLERLSKLHAEHQRDYPFRTSGLASEAIKSCPLSTKLVNKCINLLSKISSIEKKDQLFEHWIQFVEQSKKLLEKQRILNKYSDNSYVRLKVVEDLLDTEKNHERAAKLLENLSVRPSLKPRLYAAKAEVALLSNEPTIAENLLREMSQQHLDRFRVLEKIADRHNLWSKVEPMINNLLLEETVPADSYAYASYVYQEKLKKHAIAEDLLKSAITIDAYKPDYFIDLGYLLFLRKDYVESLRAYRRAQRLNPEDSLPIYNEACLLALLEKPTEAASRLKKAFEINPSLKAQAVKDPHLESLRSSSEFQDLFLAH